MKFSIFCLLLCTCVLASCTSPATDNGQSATTAASSDLAATIEEAVALHPIFHGAVVLTRGDRTIFIDPYGGAERYDRYAAPDLLLITHSHSDHLDTATLAGLDLTSTVLVAPQAVVDAMTENPFAQTRILANGENYEWEDIQVTAVAAYNPRPRDNMHPEGKFNGYVVDFSGARYYFSGDTEDVPQMRALQNIAVAFVCMNQPYTMSVESAASAVLEFAPAQVYPYHYRNKDGSKSDVAKFKLLVNEGNPSIDVILKDWYGE